jgi:hypothetical protein
MSADFGSAVKSWITGSEKFSVAMRNMGVQLVADFGGHLAQMVAKKLITDNLLALLDKTFHLQATMIAQSAKIAQIGH